MSNHVETPWPTHPDGRQKQMGEMTPEERKAQVKDAVMNTKAVFEAPAMRKTMQEFVDGTADAQTKH